MPLLDHFHAPLAPQRHWESFHANWAGAMADVLNEQLLPAGFFAEEHAHLGPRVDIDLATFAEPLSAGEANGATATAPVRIWTAPPAAYVMPAAVPDRFEVFVFDGEAGATLVAAIELISPANKDRAAHRRAFAIKCASYLCQGVSLIIVDIVTSRRANLHNEMIGLLGHGDTFAQAAETRLYAVAYRPLARDGEQQIDVWPTALAVGEALPVLPLAINAEICLPIDLEATYMAARQRRRLT